MKMIRSVVLALAVTALPAVAQAGELTVQDVLELHRAGLGREVLLALIEVDGGPFDLVAADLIHLKAEGLPEPVIAALLRAGRRLHLGTNVWAPRETVVLEAPYATETSVQVPVPVYVPVPVLRRRGHDLDTAPLVGGEPPIESSLGPRRSSATAGAVRATPSRRSTPTVDDIRHAPAGFHPGVQGTQAETPAAAPTPGVARSTAHEASPPPGVARSRSSSDEPTPGVARSRPPSDR